MSRTNKPIWQDTIVSDTGVSLQHLVNGTWQDTGMRVMPVPAGYEPEAAINRFVEGDLKSTKPEFVGETAITVQPYAYQVYKTGDDEIGFINDWSYEEWTGDTKCLSAPINRHADSRQRLVYGNFSETGNSIIIKEMIHPKLFMLPDVITIEGDTEGEAISAVITSNVSFELILSEWLTASQTAFTSGTTQFYIYPQRNADFDSRQGIIQAKHESYWTTDYEYTILSHVFQTGKSPYWAISPNPKELAWNETGLTYVSVTTNTDFSAVTTGTTSWFTYSAKTGSDLNYNVYFNVSANTGDDRNAYAIFTFVIDKTGGTQNEIVLFKQVHVPDISLDNNVIVITLPLTQSVNLNSETSWQVSSADSWFTVTPSAGTGSTQIMITCDNLNSGVYREGTVVFTNEAGKRATLRVEQEYANLATEWIYRSTDGSVLTSGTWSNFTGSTPLGDNYYRMEFATDQYGVPNDAFYNNQKLQEFYIPDYSMNGFGTAAFFGCSALTTVRIGVQQRLDLTPVFGDSGLEKIYIAEGGDVEHLPEHVVLEARAFRNRNLKEIYIPGEYIRIFDYVFSGCTQLSSIIIGSEVITPESVVRFENSEGHGPFIGCSALSSVTINGEAHIGRDTFAHLRNLVNVNIPELKSAEAGAFMGCTSLTSFDLSNYEGQLKDSMFAACTSLSSITLGTGITKITYWTFNRCSALSDINYKGTKSQWASIIKENNWNSTIPATVVHCTDGDTPI